MTEEVTWASGADLVQFRALQVSGQSDDQVIPGTRTNSPEIDRLTRKGVQPIRFSDFSGGLTRSGGIGNVKNDLNKYAINQGLWTHMPGLVYPGFNPTVVSNLNANNWSTAISIGARVHSVNSALGDTGQRWLAAIGGLIISDTSITNPALVARESLSSGIKAVAPLFLNSVNYLGFASSGQTDDLKGTTDVSGSSTFSWTELVTYSSASDTIWGMQYMAGMGPSGANIFTGSVGGTNQVWYALGTATIPATLQPIVDTSSKDVEGSLAVTTTSAATPTTTWQFGDAATTVAWANLTNLAASDNSYATVPFASSKVSYNLRVGFIGQFAPPQSAIIKGIQVGVEAHEAAANNDTTFESMQITINSATVGENRGNPNAYELNATTDTTTTFGSTTDTWGLALTGADLATIGTELILRCSGGVNAGTASVDTLTMTLTYHMPGTAISLNQGGWAVSPHPLFPNRFAYVEPVADDKTAILQPRRLCFVDMEWDSAGNRPTGTKSYPNMGGITYLHHAIPFLGGYLLTGSSAAGPGDRVVLLKGDGTTLDYQFPGFMGSTIYKVNALFPAGIYFIAQVVASDYSEMQYWLFDTVRSIWYADTVLQSKTGTSIALQPIPFSSAYLGAQQNQLYSLWPVSTTNLAGRREFMPSDLNQDPRKTNTTTRLEYQERMIGSSASSTGTVRVQIDTTGTPGFADAAGAIDTTFTAGLDATVANRGVYQVPTSGVAYQTEIMRITLDQGSGTTTAGPNGLNILQTTHQEWAEDLRVYEFQLSPDGHSKPDIIALLEELERVKTKKNVQPLKFGSVNCNASYVKVVRWQVWTGDRGSAEIAADQVSTPVLQFAERLGTV